MGSRDTWYPRHVFLAMTPQERFRVMRQQPSHTLRAAQHRHLVAKIKLDNDCLDCGRKELLTFDHRVRADKFKDVSRLYGFRHDIFFAELWKCDLVCRPCHDVRERERDKGLRPR